MTSRAVRRGCGIALVATTGAIAALAALLLVPAWRLPKDAPLARMYRTEADLTALIKAVNTYRAELGSYPPAGAEGLRMATDFLSRKGHYFPDGPPPDGWDHPFVYTPNAAYGAPNSLALRGNGAYEAPDTYQIYSLGADGAGGLDDAEKRRDNITSWESDKPWRAIYFKLNAEYMNNRRNTP